MYNDRHVNGPGIVQVRFQTGGFSRLGVSSRAIDLTPNPMWTPVISDEFGEQLPADQQWDGLWYSIGLTVVGWDETTMRKILGYLNGRTEGQSRQEDIGTMALAGGNNIGLYIESSTVTGMDRQDPHWFPSVLIKGGPKNLGTRFSAVQLQFEAYPWNGQFAMSRSAPPS